MAVPNVSPTSSTSAVDSARISRTLAILRGYVGMDVAFITRFDGASKTYEHIDTDTPLPFEEGAVVPITDGFCLRVVSGELPGLIPDTSLSAAALAVPETTQLHVGALVSSPIITAAGRTFGALCCVSHHPDATLAEHDLQLVQAFADVIALQLDQEHLDNARVAALVTRIQAILTSGALRIAYQPIYRLADGSVKGFEALTRIITDPYRTPDLWFADADDAGLGATLELHAIQQALILLPQLPSAMTLSINASPAVAASPEFERIVTDSDIARVVLEITEHASITDYEQFNAVIQPLRDRGMRLAIDDVGAGYASMRHILSLRPDIMKIDMSIVRNVDHDASRRALAKALIVFGHDIGARITAEGVETQTELDTLRDLGADHGQGYLLGRPDTPQNALTTSATLR